MNNPQYHQWLWTVQKEYERTHIEMFLVLDGTAHADLPHILWNLEAHPEASPLYMNTYFEEVVNAGPWILPFDPNGKMGQWFFENAKNHSLGFIAMIPQGQYNNYFEYMQSLLECQYPPQNKKDIRAGKERVRGLFRYYDPRILYAISTFPDKNMTSVVCGQAYALMAWEPGRQQPVLLRNTTTRAIVPQTDMDLSQEFINHLWKEVQLHTIIGTLGSDAGTHLRAMPLPESYALAERIQQRLLASPYTSNTDVAVAITAYYHGGQISHLVDAILERKMFSFSTLQHAMEETQTLNFVSDSNR